MAKLEQYINVIVKYIIFLTIFSQCSALILQHMRTDTNFIDDLYFLNIFIYRYKPE